MRKYKISTSGKTLLMLVPFAALVIVCGLFYTMADAGYQGYKEEQLHQVSTVPRGEYVLIEHNGIVTLVESSFVNYATRGVPLIDGPKEISWNQGEVTFEFIKSDKGYVINGDPERVKPELIVPKHEPIAEEIRWISQKNMSRFWWY